MKLLLTSLGLSNPTIVGALEQLLGKPISQSRMVYVPTALHGTPGGGRWAWELLNMSRPESWAEVGMLELTALPGLPEATWMPVLTRADAIVVGGGNTPYLSHWFVASGFAARLPGLLEHATYVGVSAGSMVVGSGFQIDRLRLASDGIYDDDLYGDTAPLGLGSDRTLGLVDFAVRPHLGSADFPQATLERIRAGAVGPTWVLDDESAVAVDGDEVTVASEGEWHLLS